MTDETDSEGIEYQVGGSDVDRQPSTEDADFVPFKMEPRAVFNRLAEDIYPSPRAGIREALTNAVTATLEAVENHNLDEGDAVVSFKLEQSGSRYKVSIEDNGIGMSIEKVRTVVSHIGRSTARDKRSKGGQFGMGFLALFTLCGTDGGFSMESKPRTKNTEPVCGIWKDGGFSRRTGVEPDMDNYGTKFEIFLKENIESEDIRSWVSEVAEWSRVPVLYEEETEDTTISEEYGTRDISSVTKDSSPEVYLEDNYIEIITSPSVEKDRLVLLDVPIDLDVDQIPGIKWNCVMRLKSEHKVVVDGPNEGYMVVNQSAYNQMKDDRKKKYISYQDLSERDIVSPEPTGTREKISSDERFWEYVSDVIRSKVEESIVKTCHKDVDELTTEEIKKTSSLLPCDSPYRNFRQFCRGRFSCLNDSEIEKLYSWTRRVKVKEGSKSLSCRIEKNSEYVFMTTGHINEGKYSVLKNADESISIVNLNRATWYDFYSEHLGWEELREFDESHEIYSYNLQDTSEQKSKRNENESREVKIYSGNLTYVEELDELKEKAEDTAGQRTVEIDDGVSISRFIIFSSSTDGFTRNTWMRHLDGVAVVNSNTKQSDERLRELPYSELFEDYIKQAKQEEILTSRGIMRAGEIEFSDSIVHILNERDRLNDVEKCRQMQTLMQDDCFYGVTSPDKGVYIAVEKDQFNDIAPLTRNSAVFATGIDLQLDTVSLGPRIFQCQLYLRFFESRKLDVIKSLDENIFSETDVKEETKQSVLSLLKTAKNSEVDFQKVIKNE